VFATAVVPPFGVGLTFVHFPNDIMTCLHDQEELKALVATPTAPRAAEIMEGVKLVHLALAACMVMAIWLQTTKSQKIEAKKSK
jgi:hypothetical protein